MGPFYTRKFVEVLPHFSTCMNFANLYICNQNNNAFIKNVVFFSVYTVESLHKEGYNRMTNQDQ